MSWTRPHADARSLPPTAASCWPLPPSVGFETTSLGRSRGASDPPPPPRGCPAARVDRFGVAPGRRARTDAATRYPPSPPRSDSGPRKAASRRGLRPHTRPFVIRLIRLDSTLAFHRSGAALGRLLASAGRELLACPGGVLRGDREVPLRDDVHVADGVCADVGRVRRLPLREGLVALGLVHR